MAKKKKIAFITGVTGQDGSYLAEFLLDKGYVVYGLLRRKSKPDFGNVGHICNQINFVFGDPADPACLSMYLAKIMPNEIYNLGAQSHVHESWSQPLATADQTRPGSGHFVFSNRSEMFARKPVSIRPVPVNFSAQPKSLLRTKIPPLPLPILTLPPRRWPILTLKFTANHSICLFPPAFFSTTKVPDEVRTS